jgi:hypothetical protein
MRTKTLEQGALARAVELTGELAGLLARAAGKAVVMAGLDELDEVIEALPPYVDLGLVAYFRNQASGTRREWLRGEGNAARYQMTQMHRRLERLHASLA